MLTVYGNLFFYVQPIPPVDFLDALVNEWPNLVSRTGEYYL